MSRYFQRLIEQSGLTVPAAAPPAAAPRATALHEPPSGALAAEDVVEVHEERIAPVGASPPRTPPQAVSSRVEPAHHAPPPPRNNVADTSEPEPAPAGESFRVPGAPGPDSLRSTSPAEAGSPVPAAAPGDPGQPSGIPADVMQAVMKWIAAGSPADDNSRSLAAPAAVPPAESPRPPMAAAAVTAPVPDRVIEIIEQDVALSAELPPRSPPPSEPTTVRTVEPAEMRRASSGPNRPMRVSIGSIEVVVAAAPPAAIAPPPPSSNRPIAPSRVVQPAPRATGFSKLRRHYIIPH